MNSPNHQLWTRYLFQCNNYYCSCSITVFCQYTGLRLDVSRSSQSNFSVLISCLLATSYYAHTKGNKCYFLLQSTFPIPVCGHYWKTMNTCKFSNTKLRLDLSHRLYSPNLTTTLYEIQCNCPDFLFKFLLNFACDFSQSHTVPLSLLFHCEWKA